MTTSETRPWGSWHVLDEGDGWKVKRIVVDPGCRLSYQRHELRSEHWVVVTGVATCTVDDATVVLKPGATVDVEVGQAHRIANEGDEQLVIIEVQRGSYTGEDDIVRLEDDYGRADLTHS
ncbi:phosphomannose isomerase type II C-terminal cupin domain [Nocardioides halotolerans]|uniref:phosphomannose isomerase type II C-terminal cupin domain n=1 Tax=Nocardioides halotolerans TaxID=433660 RepID=UPI000422B473|nr:phosphomannose isomerase type II C-terminal cupin domain [Nocardioides halotolerans]